MKLNKFLIIGLIILLALAIAYIEKPKIKGELPSQTDEALFDFIMENKVTGGPEKDGIPAIDEPKYVGVSEAEVQGYVDDEELVFGIDYGGEVKAYPQSIMYWHEIVNEEIQGEKLSVTYCPLTGSVIGYKGKNLGVSGALYNSNLVMYDRETDGEVPQLLGKGIDKEIRGENLDRFPVIVTTWKAWKTKYPETLVLSRNLGYDRDYDRNPYPGYDELLRVWFPLAAESDLFATKEWVFGIKHKGKFLAIPKAQFKKVSTDVVKLAGDEIKIEYDANLDAIRAYVGGEEISAIQLYWFAWYAFYPETEVWEKQKIK